MTASPDIAVREPAEAVAPALPAPPSAAPAERFPTGPLCLGMTFLFLGLSYAFPLDLWNGYAASLAVKSVGTMNLYAVTAWMGLAHFVYAIAGQFRGLARTKSPARIAGFAAALVAVWLALWPARQFVGPRLWDGLVWFYFIAHFMKAELFFTRGRHAREASLRDYVGPLAAFATFSLAVLLDETQLNRTWGLYALVAAAGAVTLMTTRRSDWADPLRSQYLLCAAFLLGETLVWGAYRPFMTETFADGVYGMHVAAASFFHYFRAYGAGMQQPRPGRMLSLPVIVAVNLGMIVAGVWLGYAAAPSAPVVACVFAPQIFTVWVAWHLIASDLFPYFRRVRPTVTK